MVQVLKRENELGSTIGSDSGSPPVGMVDIKISKQYMMCRSVGKGIGDKRENLVCL